MKNWLKRITITAGTVITAGLLVFGPDFLAAKQENKGKAETVEAPILSVRTTRAEKRTLSAFLEVNGDIVSVLQADTFPDVSGKLIQVKVVLGTWVRKGDVIALIDPSRPGAVYMNSPVYAPISGIVSKTPISVGMIVSPNTPITTVSAIDNLEISVRIPEREVACLINGLKADVTLQAYPGEIFSVTISRISPILDSTTRTKSIILTFDHYDSRINAGMFARIRLNTKTYQSVLAVPAEAIINKHGESIVFILQDGISGILFAEQREVMSGVSLNGWTEIKSGLSEGETVVVRGQQLLRGGEMVRVIAGSR
jgi:multidrug efflux pump subunit AcrA (membrane-fusion protein)